AYWKRFAPLTRRRERTERKRATSRSVLLLRSWQAGGRVRSRRLRMLRGCRRGRIRAAELRPLDEPPRLLICTQHGVAVLGTLLDATSLDLQRRAIELVEQLGMPLSQPFAGQELGRQSLESGDDPAVVGIHVPPFAQAAARLPPFTASRDSRSDRLFRCRLSCCGVRSD